MLKGRWKFARNIHAPFSNVVWSGLELYGRREKEISNAMERGITIEITKLERYIGIVGTIGNTAVILVFLVRFWVSSGHFMTLLQPEPVE